jgi:hypothetical protein
MTKREAADKLYALADMNSPSMAGYVSVQLRKIAEAMSPRQTHGARRNWSKTKKLKVEQERK